MEERQVLLALILGFSQRSSLTTCASSSSVSYSVSCMVLGHCSSLRGTPPLLAQQWGILFAATWQLQRMLSVFRRQVVTSRLSATRSCAISSMVFRKSGHILLQALPEASFPSRLSSMTWAQGSLNM